MNAMFYAVALIICTFISAMAYSSKSDNEAIVDLIKSGMEPIDKSKIRYWDKWSLASEAVKTHRMLPPETNNG